MYVCMCECKHMHAHTNTYIHTQTHTDTRAHTVFMLITDFIYDCYFAKLTLNSPMGGNR
jgi:hypothetical protein